MVLTEKGGCEALSRLGGGPGGRASRLRGCFVLLFQSYLRMASVSTLSTTVWLLSCRKSSGHPKVRLPAAYF